MRDGALSDYGPLQAELDRTGAYTAPKGRLSLDPTYALLARLGNPHLDLPPVFHVAGTNGKGSTCAFLRSMIEAAGLTVHVSTSPHLVRYNERFRVAGRLIDDAPLAELLREVNNANEGIGASFFEVSTVAAFLAFTRTPADAAIIEVGLGGRFDATNVLVQPAACGIASLGLDHEAFLLAPEPAVPLDPMSRIAFEKAGIAKPGSPLVTQHYAPPMTEAIDTVARWRGTHVAARGRDWFAELDRDTLIYRDNTGSLTLPRPVLRGRHQCDNAALAVAMLRHQSAVTVGTEAMVQGIIAASWSARMQPLADGPLTRRLPGLPIWLDGGHNPDAGKALAAALDGSVHVICGMLENKDALEFLRPFAHKIASFRAVPIPGHAHHDPAKLCALATEALAVPDAAAAATVEDALDSVTAASQALPVLICGSLYLAGEVLRANGQLPD
jgi:dihydrofolate synthase/folylpolyglutamate synthase